MNLQIDSTIPKTAILIIGTILFFYLYYYFAHSAFLKNYIKNRVQKPLNGLLLFFTEKFLGFLILGVIPGILYYYLFDFSFEKFGLTINQFSANFVIILILVFIIVFVVFINQKANSQHNSLQIKVNKWTLFLFILNSIGWIIYLIGYEFLFRGILLFECYSSFGFWPAIAINVAIYSAIHMVNGKNEVIGALIFGTIACYFTLIQGTILIPIFMHISLSLFSDYFSIKLNNKLSFISQRKFNLP